MVSSAYQQEQQHDHIGLMLLGICGDFLDDLDEIVGTNHHDVLCDMVDNLDQQDVLSTVSNLCFWFLVNDEKFAINYGNTFSREVGDIIEQIQEIVQTDDTEFDELVDLCRRWGPLCETAIPPVIASIYYLEEGEINLERSEEMSLNDNIEKIQEFPLLAPVGSKLDANLRNAILHGGKTGGYNINSMTEEIEIRYQEAGETKNKVYSKAGFQNVVIETMASVVTLFLVPLFVITNHATIEISEAKTQTNG